MSANLNYLIQPHDEYFTILTYIGLWNLLMKVEIRNANNGLGYKYNFLFCSRVNHVSDARFQKIPKSLVSLPLCWSQSHITETNAVLPHHPS